MGNSILMYNQHKYSNMKQYSSECVFINSKEQRNLRNSGLHFSHVEEET